MTATELTVLFGPPSALGRALNDIIREERAALEAAELVAYPSRIGDKALRDVLSGTPATEVLDGLAVHGGPPVLISALKALGQPSNTFRSRELLPDAEVLLASYAPLFDGLKSHVVLTLDPLHVVLHAINHTSSNTAVAATPWDALYEASWADLVREVRDALPGTRVSVLTTRRAFVTAEDALSRVFGPAAAALRADDLRAALLPNAQRLASFLPVELGSVFDRYVEAPDDGWLKESLGLDPITVRLLADRFDEDLEALKSMDGIDLL